MYVLYVFPIAVDSAVTDSSITLLWVTPQSVDETSIASYLITLSPVQDTADAVTYTLPGSRQSAVLGGNTVQPAAGPVLSNSQRGHARVARPLPLRTRAVCLRPA